MIAGGGPGQQDGRSRGTARSGRPGSRLGASREDIGQLTNRFGVRIGAGSLTPAPLGGPPVPPRPDREGVGAVPRFLPGQIERRGGGPPVPLSGPIEKGVGAGRRAELGLATPRSRRSRERGGGRSEPTRSPPTRRP
jgi:hypothetical protein